MASIIGEWPNKFGDRGYLWRKPTLAECHDMGWTIIQAFRLAAGNNLSAHRDGMNDMKLWCRDNLWWQDFVWSYSEVAFKRPEDATMFRLRWA